MGGLGWAKPGLLAWAGPGPELGVEDAIASKEEPVGWVGFESDGLGGSVGAGLAGYCD